MIKDWISKLNPAEPNYDEIEKAFSEEKKIVAIQDGNETQQIPEIDDDGEK